MALTALINLCLEIDCLEVWKRERGIVKNHYKTYSHWVFISIFTVMKDWILEIFHSRVLNFWLQICKSIRGFARPSIHPFVQLSIHPSIGPSIGPWVSPSVMIELTRTKPRISNAAVMFVYVWVFVWGGTGCGWGLRDPAHLCATILYPRVACLLNREKQRKVLKWNVTNLFTGYWQVNYDSF